MKKTTQGLWVVAWVLGAWAVPVQATAESGPPMEDAGFGCSRTADCPCGLFCISGECRFRSDPVGLGCTVDDDCGGRCTGERYQCAARQCALRPVDAGFPDDLGPDASSDTGPGTVDTGSVSPVDAAEDVPPPVDRGTPFVDAGNLDVPAPRDLGSTSPDVPTAAADVVSPVDTGTSTPPPEDDGGCSVRGGRGGRGGAGWAALVALAALGLRRRRRA